MTIPVSIVSRKTMKKIGTAKTLYMLNAMRAAYELSYA